AATNAIAMPVGALALAALSVITREGWVVPAQPSAIVVTISLVAGTVVLFTLVLYVLGRWTATAASFQFPLSVLVTVIAAAIPAGESVRPVVIAGAAVVAAGITVASGALDRRPRPRAL
ncbi:MAG: EamA family transporter, partial [Chloroflexi bacterium]|nr:EamA family transporter [Chloroflexota bacterium]